MDAAKLLQKELEVYKRRLPELRLQQGKYVVIKGDELLSIFDTYSDALTAAYKKYGLAPFLLKQISDIENTQHVTSANALHCFSS